MKYLIGLAVLLFLISAKHIEAQWIRTSGPPGGYVYSLIVKGDNIFAGTSDGIFLSTNNGSSWQCKGLTSARISSFAIRGNNLFAGTQYGVYLSSNDGTDWALVNNGLISTYISSIVSDGPKVYAGTNGYGVFVSTNNGTLWKQVNNGLTSPRINSLLISGNNIFACTDGEVFLSTNNGTFWNPVAGLYGLCLAQSGSIIYIGTVGDGVYLSTNNGTSWTKSGLSNIRIYSLIAYGNYVFAGTETNGIYCSTDSGGNWTLSQEGVYNTSANSFAVIDSFLFAGTDWQGFSFQQIMERAGSKGIITFPTRMSIHYMLKEIVFTSIATLAPY